ncbi:MAG: hypothetical protein M3R50_07730 [Bacteroidota bacterium]|nr:hypothetical protein [Bacteroidota bacterium]
MKKFRWDLLGLFAGIGGVLFAVYAVLKSGSSNSVLIAVAMIVVFGGIGFVLYKLLWQPRFNVKRLQKIGVPGKAKILEVHETNISVNNNPQLKLLIELKDTNGAVYTTICKTVVSRLKPLYFQSGKEINVRIDPANERNVIVDAS